MISLLWCFAALCIYLFARKIFLRFSSSAVSELLTPNDGLSWIWGHQMAMFKQVQADTCVKWVGELGPIFRVKGALTQPDVIFVAENVAAQHIFQNAYTYVKSPVFRPLVQKLLGRGIVWAEGDDHKQQRKLLAPAFSPNAVKGMADDVFLCAEKMSNMLRAELAHQEKQPIVNIAPFVSACALDIIGRVGFGHDFGGGQSLEAKAIADSWHRDVELSHTFGGFFAPILLNLVPWITQLPIPALQADSVAKRITVMLAGQMIQEHRAGHGKDILSLLLSGQTEGKQNSLPREILLENISTLLMVGHETSAGTVIFTMLELARHPEIQSKLRDEVRHAGALTHDTVQNISYLDAVVREGLRLYPPASRTERVVTEDDVIPLGKPILTEGGKSITSLPVKAGQVFHISFTAMNVNPEVWGPDAHEFKPERWLTPGGVPSPSELPHGPWASVASFCDGIRSCIGWRLAVLELKVMIASLVRDFQFTDSGYKVEGYVSPTLQPFTNGEAGIMPLRMSLAPEA
ncbi:hypothetical protein VNI00_006174 [Paramarasmius palmivorus]|uniref:Cytochrome P450 n=1 Tax=Paramarasmius palmivorus TaxID=297713 RepID=A0AAW0D517_9AGAR